MYKMRFDIISSSAFFAIITLTLAHPSSPSHNGHSLSTRALGGSCPHLHFPDEDQYNQGFKIFCDNAVNDANGPHNASGPHPIVGTVTLTAYDGKPIQWIYKLGSGSTKDAGWVWWPDHTACMTAFKGLVNGFPAGFLPYKDANENEWQGGSKLGENYCVVDGSGDQGLSGQGVVLVMGGKAQVKNSVDVGPVAAGSFKTVESRQRLDDGHEES